MGELITNLIKKYVPSWYFPEIRITDIIEVIILAVVIYQLLRWISNTKAWMLLKGMLVLAVFILIAAILHMNTILFLAKNLVTVLATVAIVVFQPELRRALEKIGEKNFIPSIGTEKLRVREKEKIIESVVEAAYEMGAVKTGALMVIERAARLTEYEATGIPLDCLVSKEVIINIFEHNTPLHDGAIMIRGNRITSATCYLPLSDNMKLSKDLGTRHRAAVGMSEVSDALIIVVSEETGAVSLAFAGKISRRLSKAELFDKLRVAIETKPARNPVSKLFKGGEKDEK